MKNHDSKFLAKIRKRSKWLYGDESRSDLILIRHDQRWSIVSCCIFTLQFIIRFDTFILGLSSGDEPMFHQILTVSFLFVAIYLLVSIIRSEALRSRIEDALVDQCSDIVANPKPCANETLQETNPMKPIKMPNKSQYPTPTASESEVHTQF